MNQPPDKPKDNSKDNGQTALFAKGIDLKTNKIIRIAVSGDVQLNKLETLIIDTPDFQRLRSIRQLGTTYLVYPTALHTRFDHSLGTLSMALDMVRCIRENKHNDGDEKQISDEQEQLIRLTALLHDIGHIPFGHTLEDEFCIFTRHDKDLPRIERFLGPESKIGRLLTEHLGKELYERFMRIYKTSKETLTDLGGDLFIYDLVNNTVCADLLDYLKRDGYFCNMALEMDYRFLKFLYLRKEGNLKRVVIRLWKEGRPTPRQDLLTELIRLLDNRYMIGERAYFHHAKLITGAMVAGAVKRAQAEGELKKEDLYEIGDETLLDKLQQSRNPAVKKLVLALKERRLWSKAYERTRQTVEAEQSRVRNLDVLPTIMDNWWRDSENRLSNEDRIAKTLGMDSGDILIHCPGEEMAMKPADMLVFWDGNLKPLRDCTNDSITADKLSVILRSHKNLWAIRVFNNPEHNDKEEQIRHACRHLFTFVDEKKKREGKSYYEYVVKDIVKKSHLATEMPYDQYNARTANAVERLTSDTATIRDISEIKRIVKDAFKLPVTKES